MEKRVTIIIPVYNGSNYLKDAIDSSLKQTYKNLEIIVVNDGSYDDGKTKAIAESYGEQIIYIEKENGGVSTALNLGIQHATGEYISWLSHDDMYYPTKIEKEVDELKKHDENTIVFSNYDLVNETGEKLKSVYLDHNLVEKRPDYAVLRGMIGGITLLIPKKAFEECGEFDITLRCTQDYDMWFKMLNNYKFIHIKDILSMTRVHSLQDSNTSPRMLTEGNKLWIDIAKKYPKEKKIKLEGSEYIFYKEMENYLKNTPYDEAIETVKLLAEETLAEENIKDTSITVIIIDQDDKFALQKTLNSVQKQNIKNLKIFIEGKTKINNIINTKNRADSLKKISTDYYTFLTSGIEATEEWLNKQLLIAKISTKAVIISDYDRPNKNSMSDNYTTLLTPIDGIIYNSKYKANYTQPYIYNYEMAKQGGSVTLEENYLINKPNIYNMKEVYEFLTRLLDDKILNDYQIATICYEIACIYNKNEIKNKLVDMYEPCSSLRELMYSRSFRLLKKYMDYKQAKRKAKQNKK